MGVLVGVFVGTIMGTIMGSLVGVLVGLLCVHASSVFFHPFVIQNCPCFFTHKMTSLVRSPLTGAPCQGSFRGQSRKIRFSKFLGSGLKKFVDSVNRGQKRHINIWHMNDFSVTPGHRSSRPGARTKMFMFLGFRTQHINV